MKRHLSSRQNTGILGHIPTWLVPVTFQDQNNDMIDSRDMLTVNGFEIHQVSSDTRYYKVTPPNYWSRYPVDGTYEVYNDKNECVFVQVIETDKYFSKGQVYWKASEDMSEAPV